MTYNTGEKHLVEIDHVSMLEAIDERFDSITSLMTENAVMYGSTVTALVAGLPIVGDLDIAVSKHEYSDLTRQVASSVKWLQTDGPTVPEGGVRSNPSSPRGFASSSSRPESKGKYSGAKHMPIAKVVSFSAVNDAKIQIMESKSMTGDPLEDSLNVVRKVDFTFCGVAFDRYGRILETIPHAYDDCIQRIIRIREYQHQTDPKQLKYRIHKYVKRGWSLTFSIDQAMINLEAAKQAYLKRLAAKPPRKSSKNKGTPGLKIRSSFSKGVFIEVSKGLTKAVGSRGSIIDMINAFTSKRYSIGMRWNTIPNGITQCWQRNQDQDNQRFTFDKAKTIVNEVSQHILERYSIDTARIVNAEKDVEMEKLYNLGAGGYAVKT